MTRGVIELRDAIRARDLSAREAVEGALRQIEAVQPRLFAAARLLRDEALAAAEAVDRRLAAGEDPGPLAGIPYTAKDNIATSHAETNAGSRILAGYRSPYDATAIERLNAAGAICVAKTNLDEFGMGSSSENCCWGAVRNPWDPERVPGGSSGGAAALAASTRGIVHIGSDTGGSLRQPAAYCGVTGLKPTYGRVSRYGLLAFASSLDQIGPIQGSALDCAAVLETIAGHDSQDATSHRAPVGRYVEEARQDIRGLRVGYAPEHFPEGLAPAVRRRVEEGIETLRDLGAEVREVSLPNARYANPAYMLVSAAEASSNLARYDGVHYGHRGTEEEGLLEMYRRSRGEGFGAEVKRRILVGTFVLSSGYYEAYYLTALKVRSLIRRDFERAFEEVDVIAGPTAPVPPFRIGERIADPLALYAVDILTVPANLAGVPGVSCPCGFTEDGLPVGLQFHARPFEEGAALRAVRAFQEATDFHRRTPPVSAGDGAGG